MFFAARFRNIFPRARAEDIAGIEVRGSDSFRARTREALDLLGNTDALILLQNHVKVIRQGRRSGMRAWASRPTFVVGKATWRHSPLWYAGAIAHDAYHAKLYHEAKQAGGGAEPEAGAWIGGGAERCCLEYQYAVLKALNSDAATLNYVAAWHENPAYAGRSGGIVGWLDYLRRWW
jgi:hypothetical protein